MKNILLIIALLTVTVNADMDSCKLIGSISNLMMKNRQSGVPLTDILKGINLEKSSDRIDRLYTSIAIEAYNIQRFNSIKAQKIMIQEFENKYLVDCLRGK